MDEQVHQVDRFQVQIASIQGDGMHLEVCANTIHSEPLMTIRAEDEDTRLVAIRTVKGQIVFPLAELERVIAFARQQVHCEAYYDQEYSQ